MCTSTGKWSDVTYLNELEYIDGYIYANIWQSSQIAIIEPQSGIVVKWVSEVE